MAKKEFVKVESGGNIWLPKKVDEEIVGIVSEIIDGQYGKQYVFLQEDGNEITTPSHKVLQGRMAKVKKGDTVKIVHTGSDLPKVKGRNNTELYDVFVEQ